MKFSIAVDGNNLLLSKEGMTSENSDNVLIYGAVSGVIFILLSSSIGLYLLVKKNTNSKVTSPSTQINGKKNSMIKPPKYKIVHGV